MTKIYSLAALQALWKCTPHPDTAPRFGRSNHKLLLGSENKYTDARSDIPVCAGEAW